MKGKIKFENYKHCLKGSKLENKIYHLEKHKFDVDSLQKYRQEFIKLNRLMLKSQQRFRRKNYNTFTEDVNKSA